MAGPTSKYNLLYFNLTFTKVLAAAMMLFVKIENNCPFAYLQQTLVVVGV